MAFTGTGWLNRVEGRVRKWVDEPSSNAKFSDDDIYDLIRLVYAKVFPDVLIHDEASLVVRYDITMVANQQEYVLPPNVGMILRLARRDSTSDLVLQEMYQSNFINPSGGGYTIEGNILRLTNKINWSDNTVYELLYIPNGDMYPIEFATTVYGTDTTNKTWTIGSVTDGTLDTRKNAYGGYLLRFLSADTNNFVQEIPVASYDNENGRIVLVSAPDPVPVTNVKAELVPVLTKQFEDVVSLGVARRILAIDGHARRKDLVDQEYREAVRSLRMQISKVQQRLSSRYDGRTPENEDYLLSALNLGYWGII